MLLRGWARRSAPLPPQVYSLVVVLPRTPLKERISLPCERPGGAARGGGVVGGCRVGGWGVVEGWLGFLGWLGGLGWG